MALYLRVTGLAIGALIAGGCGGNSSGSFVSDPGGSTGDDLYSHQGEEAGLVLQGRIELQIGAEHFQLEAGDSFSFPSHLPHRYANPGSEEAVIVWANAPVTLRS